MVKKSITYSCKNCGFFDKCPEDYLCPALECLITIYIELDAMDLLGGEE